MNLGRLRSSCPDVFYQGLAYSYFNFICPILVFLCLDLFAHFVCPIPVCSYLVLGFAYSYLGLAYPNLA